MIALLPLLGLVLPVSEQRPPSRAPINTLQEIGPALYACWKPPADVQSFEVTVRLSFKRDGEVLGKPMITFSRFNGDGIEQQRIVAAILTALAECTPLNLTPSLGGAIAGRVFTLRFVPPSRRA